MALPDLQTWYNNSDSYPDLTMQLNDGRKILVHRAVICQNVWFKGAVEHSSALLSNGMRRFKVDYDAQMIDLIIRNLYGFKLPRANEQAWKFWQKLYCIATRHLIPGLEAEAEQHFRAAAFNLTEVKDIRELIRFLTSSYRPDGPELVIPLHQHYATTPLRHEDYRKELDGNKALMWQHLDNFLAASDDGAK